MTTNWSPTAFPASLDSFSPRLVDNVDQVIANHPNTLAGAIEAIQAKLGSTNTPLTGIGGLSFNSSGKASNPGTAGDPTLWVDNSSPGFDLKYTDELGNTYTIALEGSSGFYGLNYSHSGVSVGELVYVSAANTVAVADATAGNPARGIVITVNGASCDISYGSEIVNPAWTLTSGSTYYLGDGGVFVLAASIPVTATIIQEVGFARNTTTLVFRPTIVSVV